MFRTAYGPRHRVQFEFYQPSRVHQSFRDEADINRIVNQYAKTGQLPWTRSDQPRYIDTTEVKDFHSALDTVIAAQAAFEDLPADVRRRFANDPGEMVQFLQDPENRSEAEKLGLIEPQRPAQSPIAADVEDPPTEPESEAE